MKKGRKINDDWSAINSSVYDGSYMSKYRRGDYKDLNGEIMTVTKVGKKGIGGPYLEFASEDHDFTYCIF